MASTHASSSWAVAVLVGAALLLVLSPAESAAQRARPAATAAKPGASVPGASAEAPPTALPGPAWPRFENAAEVTAACVAGLHDAQAAVAALEERKADATWLGAYDDLHGLIEDASRPMALFASVHPDAAVRAEALACDARWHAFDDALRINDRLYARLKSLAPKDEADVRLRRLAMEAFEDAGVALPSPRRERAKNLVERMAALAGTFERNLREAATRVAFRVSELNGVPERVLERSERDAAGLLLVALDAPTYDDVMTYADDGITRERIWRAKANEGGEANARVLAELVQVRKSYAQLFGFDSYADFVLRRRMLQDAKRVGRWLDELRPIVDAAERREIMQLREAKARHLAMPNAKLEPWDVAYYIARLRGERYGVAPEVFRSHFPPAESLAFVMGIAERLFGVRYVPVEGAFWHADVRAYVVTDAATQRTLGGLVVDAYPREGKTVQSAAWGLRSSAARVGRLPVSALVVNLDRRGLTLDELGALLHEFGHTLHDDLSATRHVGLGTSAVALDFVEAPAQMFEAWAFDARVLAGFAEACPACKPLPPELLQQAAQGRRFGKAVQQARQLLHAGFDLALHGPAAPEPITTWRAMQSLTPLGFVEGTRVPAGLVGLAGDEAMSVYVPLWSTELAHDLRTAFEPDRLSPTAGARLRTTVLGQGAQRPAGDLLRQFLGREPSLRAFEQQLRR